MIALAFFVSVFVLRYLLLDSFPPAAPKVTDEFSYLFAADTFAEGRLTNPPYPHEKSFETRHILTHPTVMSKYQPATAVFLLIGQKLFGHYHWGMCLAVAMLAAVSYWTLRIWSNRYIALPLCTLMVLLLRAPHYWIYSYWGGAHVMAACMLMLCAYHYIFHRNKPGYVWVGLAGLILGLLSRPYETAVLAATLLVCGMVHVRQFSPPAERLQTLKQLALPCCVVVGCYLIFQGYYNYAITGDVFQLPYTLYQKQYGAVPHWIFDKVRMERWPSNDIVASLQVHELDVFKNQIGLLKNWFDRHPPTIARMLVMNRLLDRPELFKAYGMVTVLYHVTMPLVLAYVCIKRRRHYALLSCLLATTLAFTVMTVMFPHYLVAYMAVQLIIFAILIREFYSAPGSKLFEVICTAAVLVPIIFFISRPFEADSQPDNNNQIFWDHILDKPKVEEQLMAIDGKHLVLVNHSIEMAERMISQVWIYNSPNIDESKIIWAQYLSDEDNKKIISHYSDRTIWYYEPYKEKKLTHYRNK